MQRSVYKRTYCSLLDFHRSHHSRRNRHSATRPAYTSASPRSTRNPYHTLQAEPVSHHVSRGPYYVKHVTLLTYHTIIHHLRHEYTLLTTRVLTTRSLITYHTITQFLSHDNSSLTTRPLITYHTTTHHLPHDHSSLTTPPLITSHTNTHH